MLSAQKIAGFAATALLVGAAVFLAGCSGPSGDSGSPSDSDPVQVTVVAVPDAAVPGQSVTLLWEFSLADDWHLYWAGRNDSGYPPKIDLELPAGWVAGGLQWPVPERHVSPGDILDHVYFEKMTLLQKVGVPDGAGIGQDVTIKADVQWLACKNMCVPGRRTVTLSLPVAAKAPAVDETPAAKVAELLPGPLPERTLETGWDGTVFNIQGPEVRLLTFMPTEDCGQLVDLLNDGQGERLALRFKSKGGTVGPVRGLIRIETESGTSSTYRIEFPAAVLADDPTGG